MLFCLFFLKFNHCLYGIQLEWVKSPEWSLKAEFISMLKQEFNADNFVETGTLSGGTTNKARLIFDSVYTVELGKKLYQAACDRFKNDKNVHVYYGDSGSVLTKILPNVTGKIIFWLDAHASGGDTAMGSSYSPVIEELQAIKISKIADAVILIDDLRDFYEQTWPHISQAIKAFLEINPQYKIIAYGDILIAYPTTQKFIFSPCIEACTISRLFDTNCFNYTLDELFAAEKLIACTQGDELDALNQYFSLWEKTSGDNHGLLWKALILESHKKYTEACSVLKKILDSPNPRKINHWRINWYFARAAFKAGNKNLAKKVLMTLLKEQPNFKPAQDLLQVAG